jgi:hypothetical protein
MSSRSKTAKFLVPQTLRKNDNGEYIVIDGPEYITIPIDAHDESDEDFDNDFDNDSDPEKWRRELLEDGFVIEAVEYLQPPNNSTNTTTATSTNEHPLLAQTRQTLELVSELQSKATSLETELADERLCHAATSRLNKHRSNELKRKNTNLQSQVTELEEQLIEIEDKANNFEALASNLQTELDKTKRLYRAEQKDNAILVRKLNTSNKNLDEERKKRTKAERDIEIFRHYDEQNATHVSKALLARKKTKPLLAKYNKA